MSEETKSSADDQLLCELNDKLVEAMAKAMYDSHRDETPLMPTWEELEDNEYDMEREVWREDARVALDAVNASADHMLITLARVQRQ